LDVLSSTLFDNENAFHLLIIVAITGGELSDKTLCSSAQQYLSSHYNLHSMYGHFEAKVTYE